MPPVDRIMLGKPAVAGGGQTEQIDGFTACTAGSRQSAATGERSKPSRRHHRPPTSPSSLQWSLLPVPPLANLVAEPLPASS